MAKTQACPECKVLFDPRGLAQHRTTAHGVAPSAAAAASSPEPEAAPAERDDAPAAPAAPTKPARNLWNFLDPDW